MSKIVCDVCGTSYPETATQCPICGCVHSLDSRTAPSVETEEINPTPVSNYTFVKGGRFSKANVKKRNNARKVEHPQPVEEPEEEEIPVEPVENKKQKTDKGLVVAFIVLLFSVLAMLTYILARFITPAGSTPNNPNRPGNNGVEQTVATQAEDENVSCEDITVSQSVITLSASGETFTIEAELTPADTTDEITFDSADESIATVDAEGVVTAVGNGQTTITISCGAVVKTIQVNCTISGEQTDPVDPALKLNRTEFTMSTKGETWELYDGTLTADKITWKSSDEKVATVDNGKVVAVSTGRTVITAEYNGNKTECVVYCADSVGAYVESEGDETGNEGEGKTYNLNTGDHRQNDITIYVGNSYTIKLLDEEDNVMDAKFTTSNKNVCSVSSSGRVTGKSPGKVTITATYDGQTFTCIVRVRAKQS